MWGIGKRYRLVLRDADGSLRAGTAQTRSQALAGFGQRVAAGGFSPWDGSRRLAVMSEEEWANLRASQPVLAEGGGHLDGEAPDGSRWSLRRLAGRR